MKKFNKGIYKPVNPQKYIGKQIIIYRSGWERIAMREFDLNPSVIKWCSEEVVIPYYNSIKKKMSRYFPDFYAEVKNKEGKIEKLIIEIKPQKEIDPPKVGTRKKEATKLYEALTYVNNQEKWEAAEKYCKLNGLRFLVLSENQIFKKVS
jgi:hypothetical protein